MHHKVFMTYHVVVLGAVLFTRRMIRKKIEFFSTFNTPSSRWMGWDGGCIMMQRASSIEYRVIIHHHQSSIITSQGTFHKYIDVIVTMKENYTIALLCYCRLSLCLVVVRRHIFCLKNFRLHGTSTLKQ